MRRSTRFALSLAFVGFGALSCSDSPTDNPGTLAISVAPATVEVQQGAGGSVTVTLVRTDVTAPVDLTVTGLPTGVTAAIDPSQLVGTALTATATFAAAGTAALGTSTVTIRASAVSVEDASTTLALEVVEPGPFEGPIWIVPAFGAAAASPPARVDPVNLVPMLLVIALLVIQWATAPLDFEVGTGAAASSAGGSGPEGSAPAEQVVAEAPSLALFTGGYLAPNVLNTATLYDRVTGTTQDLTMTAARGQHTQTRLNDGRALVVGGFGPTQPGAGVTTWGTAEIFNPQTRAFAATGSMAEPRGNHAAALLLDGRVLVAGGESGFTTHRSSEIYDPATGTFSSAGNMVAARSLHSATALPDGRVLIAGGHGAAGERHASAEVFSAATGQFTAVGAMSSAHGNGHTATRLADGRVLIVGGWWQLVDATAAADLFNPATNTFTPVGPMSVSRFNHEATLLPDGRVIVVGGQSDEGDNLTSTEIFDPATGTFSAGPEAPGIAFDVASVMLY